jgi:uncharacterized protein YndB with AHSA1/START domain
MTKVGNDTQADGGTIDGVVRLDGDAMAVHFERHYTTSVEDLWSAITEPARLARWFETVEPGEGGLREGGAYRIDWGEGGITEGSIERCRPPHELQVAWSFPGEPTSRLVVQVRSATGVVDDDAGAVLVLDHSRLPANQAAGYGAGWHAYLDRLTAEAVSSDAGASTGTTERFDWDGRWTELMPEYWAAFGALTEGSGDPT